MDRTALPVPVSRPKVSPKAGSAVTKKSSASTKRSSKAGPTYDERILLPNNMATDACLEQVVASQEGFQPTTATTPTKVHLAMVPPAATPGVLPPTPEQLLDDSVTEAYATVFLAVQLSQAAMELRAKAPKLTPASYAAVLRGERRAAKEKAPLVQEEERSATTEGSTCTSDEEEVAAAEVAPAAGGAAQLAMATGGTAPVKASPSIATVETETPEAPTPEAASPLWGSRRSSLAGASRRVSQVAATAADVIVGAGRDTAQLVVASFKVGSDKMGRKFSKAGRKVDKGLQKMKQSVVKTSSKIGEKLDASWEGLKDSCGKVGSKADAGWEDVKQGAAAKAAEAREGARGLLAAFRMGFKRLVVCGSGKHMPRESA